MNIWLLLQPAEPFVGRPENAQCVLVPAGANVTVGDVWEFAAANNAVVDDPDDAPDDQVIVRFGNGGQELLTADQLVARLRS